MQQMREAFPWDEAPRYVLRDRDTIYGRDFAAVTRDMGMEEVLAAPRSPWQNPLVERLVGSIRRECLDHVIVWNEISLRRTLHSYFSYYQRSRTHVALGKDSPEPRAVKPPEQGRVVAIPQVGDYTTDTSVAPLSDLKKQALHPTFRFGRKANVPRVRHAHVRMPPTPTPWSRRYACGGVQRNVTPSYSCFLFCLLSPSENPSLVGKGLARAALDRATRNGQSRSAAAGRRAAPSLRTTGCLKEPESIVLRAASARPFEIRFRLRSFTHAYVRDFHLPDSSRSQAARASRFALGE